MTTFVFVLMGLVVTLFFSRRMKKVRQEAATYRAYAVRDALVLLVAEGKLSKDSKAFRYYYGIINSLLSDAPNVGMHHIIESLLRVKKDQEFHQALKKAQATVLKIKEQFEKNSDPEVLEVIADFYAAFGAMITTHSSIVRLGLLAMREKRAFVTTVQALLPPESRNAIESAKFAAEAEEGYRSMVPA